MAGDMVEKAISSKGRGRFLEGYENVNLRDTEAATLSKNYESYERIKRLILDRRLSPGQKLIYRDLEEKLGMTKTPIINGLVMLEKEGFVVSEKNRGFYVKEIDVQEAENILELRERLEEIVLEYAMARYVKQDLVLLKQKLGDYVEYESPVYDGKRRLLDTEFHMQIAAMGKNHFLTEMMRHFYESVFFNIAVVYLSPYVPEFKEEHRMIYESIKARDMEGAKKILGKHNRWSRDLFRSMISTSNL